MSSIFPKISINRVDVKRTSLKIFASVDSPGSTERPYWLDEEEFAAYINCSFLLVGEFDNFERGRDVTINSFPRSEQVFQELQMPTNRIQNLLNRDTNAEELITNITLEEIRQSPYGTSVGDAISMDFVSSKIHFEVDIDLSVTRLSQDFEGTVDLEDILQSSEHDLGLAIIYYSHVNYQEIESEYGVRNGESEVRRLGGIAQYLPLVFFNASTKKITSPSPNIVSIQVQLDGDTPFEGYFGLPSIMMHQDDQDSPAALPGGGFPDPNIWRSRINYDSIYGSSDRTEPFIREADVIDRVKKQLALKAVEDHSFALMHHVSWNNRRRTIDQEQNRNLNISNPDRTLLQEQRGEVDAYSSMFVLDILKVLTRMSPVGFLLDQDFTALSDQEHRTLIEKCFERSDFNLKITRKRLSTSANACNKVGTPDYLILHSENDPFIVQDQINNQAETFTETEQFTLEEVDLPGRTIEDLNFYFAKVVKLHDKGLFLTGKQGDKYKYYIELSVSDGIPKVLQLDYIQPIKNHIKIVKNFLAKAEGIHSDGSSPAFEGYSGISSILESPALETNISSNYNFLTNQWSERFLNTENFDPLEDAVRKYAATLQLLGMELRSETISELVNSILPSSNTSLDSLKLFYKSLLQAESILVVMYDKITNHEDGLAGELYANKKMVPSNDRTNIIDVCFYTGNPVTVELREGMIADFGRLDIQNITRPREIYLEVFTEERERIVSSPLIFQHAEDEQSSSILILNEVNGAIEQYDYFLDYINKAQKENPFFPINDGLIPTNTTLRSPANWPLRLDSYKRSVANIASYLPSTTFEVPLINRSFRSNSQGLSEDNDGLESLSYTNLESALFEAYQTDSDLDRYIEDLQNNQSEEQLIASYTLQSVGSLNLSKILKVMKTIETFQEEYDAFSILETQPTTDQNFADKYFPFVNSLKGITTSGKVRSVSGSDDLEDLVVVYVENTEQKYKKLNFIIVNNFAIVNS